MELAMYQADAFTSRLFAGNPAAVCPLEGWLPDHTMLSIAEENNLSETAFFVREKDNIYTLRWFTPVSEVDLCGHATLATAHVMYNQLGYQLPEIHFETRSGRLTVYRVHDGYLMDFPNDPVRETACPDMAGILGCQPLFVGEGVTDYLVEVKDQQTVESLKPDFRAMAALGGRGVIVTAPGENTDIVSRCFYPAYGIDEDPVTGSAHTTLFTYWGSKWDKTRMTAMQLSARKGWIEGEIQGERIRLKGSAVTYLSGTIYLP
jgi:PhzF family phenazine biosynthesis protein